MEVLFVIKDFLCDSHKVMSVIFFHSKVTPKLIAKQSD